MKVKKKKLPRINFENLFLFIKQGRELYKQMATRISIDHAYQH